MSKNKLETRVISAFGSINLNGVENSAIFMKLLANFFEDYAVCEEYYLIEHNETETLHIHYLIRLNKQVRLSTLINLISDGMNINPLAINIDKCRGFNQCLRYMLHIDDSSKLENKKVYQVSDIVSSSDEKNIINLIQSDDDLDLSWELLIKAVIKYSRTSDLIKYLGLKNYHKYRFEIKDLIEEKLNYPTFLKQYGYLEDETPF